ncbi:phosphoglycolate phosphatase [Halomonas vilamensis]|uniref:Phosphoglycolate phosphatase n=1 Tax=Vreelandella vilamensis TaxID=531309 RepID=A0ABU1H2S1_9GAMM|nr:phosphoglycolate phosphatase [Halomonas vilamensis]MDR5898606.1 phosphoglycolate phosphatase [Halomonas vilamensis]
MHLTLKGKRLVAFDLDGTLIDSVPDLAVAVQKTLDDQGLAVPQEADVRDWVGNGAPVLVERALTWALNEPPSEERQAESYREFLAHYAHAPNRLTRLYPGAAETLSVLKEAGLTLVLITNKPEDFIAPILEHFDLSGYFDLTLGGDSLARKKPDPLPLLHAAEYFGVPTCECAMVGDSRHDIGAGKAAAFTTFGLPYGYNHGEPISDSHPDVLLDTLDDLISSTTGSSTTGSSTTVLSTTGTA